MVVAIWITAIVCLGIAEWFRYRRRFPRWRAKRCGCASLESRYFKDAKGGNSILAYKCDRHVLFPNEP